MVVTTYDFTGLTKAQQMLLSFQGWCVQDAQVRQQPSKRTVAKLIERGLVIPHKRGSGFYVMEYEVPIAVHIAWCERCERLASRRVRR